MSILDSIQGHDDLVRLTDDERGQLCQQIREFLISKVSKTGGHLASNLGVVELTVALETVYNTNIDRLVFDVGHQSYVHKLLTGRQADFDSLRTYGGMAGFPKPSESDADAFVAGHASNSVSIALGMARARTQLRRSYHVVALIGDGSATGGLAYEGLNDAAESKEPMVVILNDNEMSIERNVGGMARHLAKVRTRSGYLVAKQRYRKFLSKLPGGNWLYRTTRRAKDWVRRMLVMPNVFENMGLTYLGPVDGHNLPGLISLLTQAKQLNRPVLIHVLTQKGKGYRPAEEHPDTFHGIGKFDPDTGVTPSKNAKTFSASFGEQMCQLAEEEPRLCAVTAAMPAGTGLLQFKAQYPQRLFDVGIAEGHAVSMAGGLAMQGVIPVVALYSTFMQRAYDMLQQDIGLLGLHAIFAVDRAGLVGEDGETHHGVFDVGFLRQIPGMCVLAPASLAEQQQMLRWAVMEQTGPVAIRYPRGSERGWQDCGWPARLMEHCTGEKICLLTYGVILEQVLNAAKRLQQQGIQVGVQRLLCLAPLPIERLVQSLAGYSYVFVIEETCAGSGVVQALANELSELNIRVIGVDLGAGYVPHGSLDALYTHCGLDAQSIADRVREVVRDEN